MMGDKLRFLICAVLFFSGIGVSILGHRTEGMDGVFLMFLGPLMYLLLLYLYNRKYR